MSRILMRAALRELYTNIYNCDTIGIIESFSANILFENISIHIQNPQQSTKPLAETSNHRHYTKML